MPPFPYLIFYLDACNFDTEVQVRSITAEQLSKYPWVDVSEAGEYPLFLSAP